MAYSLKQKKIIANKIKEPKYFISNVLGLTDGNAPWDKQYEIINAIQNHKRVAVKSANGVGKTWTAAVLALHFLYSRNRSKVITTAPTWNQVEKLLWSEIRSIYKKSLVDLGGTLLQTELKLEDNWFAMGLSTNEETRFQGLHAENILIIFDEALGIDDKIWAAADGNLTSSNARMLAIGNPTVPKGRFYRCFTSPLWHKITISAFDSPNLKGNGVVKPRLVTKQWVDEKKQEYGEKSPFYKSRVLGEFPVEGEDTLIPLTWVERAMSNSITPQSDSECYLGVDVARYGDDSTVFAVYSDNVLVFIDGYQGKNTTRTVGEIVNLHRKYNFKTIAVDDTGVGGGVTDQLEEQGLPVLGVNFGSKAKESEKYDNLKAEIFWNLRTEMEASGIGLVKHDRLLEELPSILYEVTSRGKLKIVSKDKMKAMGVKSPDYADALAIAHYATYASNKGILSFYEQEVEKNESSTASIIANLQSNY